MYDENFLNALFEEHIIHPTPKILRLWGVENQNTS